MDTYLKEDILNEFIYLRDLLDLENKYMITHLYYGCLYNNSKAYENFESFINNLKISEDLRKKYHDSNFVLFVGSSRLDNNALLQNIKTSGVNIRDNSVTVGKTIYCNVDSDINFLKVIAKRRDIDIEEDSDSLFFTVHDFRKDKPKIKSK